MDKLVNILLFKNSLHQFVSVCLAKDLKINPFFIEYPVNSQGLPYSSKPPASI